MSKYDQIISRLNEFTGILREENFEVLRALGWGLRSVGGKFLACPYDDTTVIKRPDGDWLPAKDVPFATRSIDAALALAKENLKEEWFLAQLLDERLPIRLSHTYTIG